MQIKMLEFIVLILFTSKNVLSCSYFTLFDYRYATTKDEYKFNYDTIPLEETRSPEEAKEEAIMLIGGKMCTSTECSVEYNRGDANIEAGIETKKRRVPSFDRTIKFFTKYGFCRVTNYTMPMLPVHVNSVGAVALPDGRVLICGGEIFEQTEDEFVSKNSTLCWFWYKNSSKVVEAEFFSKLPFKWLGPLSPKGMQIIRFMDNSELETSDEFVDSNSDLSERSGWAISGLKRVNKKRLRIIKDNLSWWSHQKSFNSQPQQKRNHAHEIVNRATEMEDADPGPFKDRFTLEEPTKEEMKLQRRYEFYRILIIPTPRYTQAAQNLLEKKELTANKIGELIEGRIRVTKYGPRIFWKKHILNSMPLGYGGCYIPEYIPETNRYRIHTFGGRELGVSLKGEDEGWMADSNKVVKFSRYFEIGLETYPSANNTNTTTGSLYLEEGGKVHLDHCNDDSTLKEYFKNQDATANTDDIKIMIRNTKVQSNEQHMTLEEDRVFHTCHLLPKNAHADEQSPAYRTETIAKKDLDPPKQIILIGGGTGWHFTDRPFAAHFEYTPIYKSIATFKLEAPPENEQVNGECSNTKGHWVPEDRSFGYKGLNVPRSRHASDVLKTTERRNGKILAVQTLWVFGGYNSLHDGNVLDTIESFELNKFKEKFHIYDTGDKEETLGSKHAFRYRLPWPLMDITTVKIPLHWLPQPCIRQYIQRRKAHYFETINSRTLDEKIKEQKLMESNLPEDVINA